MRKLLEKGRLRIRGSDRGQGDRPQKKQQLAPEPRTGQQGSGIALPIHLSKETVDAPYSVKGGEERRGEETRGEEGRKHSDVSEWEVGVNVCCHGGCCHGG